MVYKFSKTHIGYSHINNKKPCQDFSCSYHDEEKTIITSCDGHGGTLYIRSDKGSKFASRAIMEAFLNVNSKQLKLSDEDLLKHIKLNALTEWNKLVEQDLSRNPIKKKEVLHLNSNDLFRLQSNQNKAYGTTMIGAMIYKNKLIVIQLGDGGAFIYSKGNITPAIDDDDELAGNITYSMCSDNAFNHMHGAIYDFKKVDGILICSDGVLNPYQNYTNFYNFMKNIIINVNDNNFDEIKNYVVDLGEKSGIGDDVSLALVQKKKIIAKKYN